MSKRRVHFVLSTHWDREWRATFQDLRYDLVRLMDSVLAGFETGRLLGPFVTDGQSIVLEDYLEIRPERRSQIERLAGERKLSVGPWYVMPDEFLVSGESLVRNLRYGREAARRLGGQPSAAGYVCDMFGHNSQMPQIFAGFGISGALVWRGLNTTDRRNLIWRGADGSELPTYRFGNHGYGLYAYVVRRGFDYDDPHDPQRFPGLLEEYLRDECQTSDVDPILMLDGCDHQAWDQSAYALLQKEMERPDSEYEIVHTDFDTFLAEMAAQRERIETVLEGELREPGRQTRQSHTDFLQVDHQWLIPGVLSSRPWIKLANRACETLLCQWAEPFSAWANAALNEEYPQGFLDEAWKWLLQNHPHDSIGGCSIDQVHRDMVYRFDQAREIAETLTQRATRHLAAGIEGEVGDDEVRVVVFNPLPRPYEQVTELSLQIPTDWPTFQEFFGFEGKPAFRLFDAEGNELAYQRLAQAMSRAKARIRDTKFPEAYRTHDVTVAVGLSIPALGYTTLSLRAGKPFEPTRHPDALGLATSERSMANEHLSVEIEPNGTLALTDRRSGEVYRRLLTFEDCADIGDGWFHGVAVNDRVIVSSAGRSEVSLVRNGPLLAAFRIRTWLSVPEAFDFASMVRADRTTEMLIDSLITLRRGQDFLDVTTTVNNQVRDHRLRVLFPSGAKADTYLADSQFDVMERPIALRADNHLYRELEIETKPQQSWTAVFDDRRGLAIVAEGLLETAVRDLPERPIALTLLRATGRTALTDGEPDGQVQGSLRFHYYIKPIAGAPDRASLCELGQRISAGVRAVHMRRQDIVMDRVQSGLPAVASFLQVEGPAVVASVRRLGAGLEVRLFNPATETISARLVGTGVPAGSVQRVDFESQPIGEPERWTGEMALSLPPKRIVTLRVTPAG